MKGSIREHAEGDFKPSNIFLSEATCRHAGCLYS